MKLQSTVHVEKLLWSPYSLCSSSSHSAETVSGFCVKMSTLESVDPPATLSSETLTHDPFTGCRIGLMKTNGVEEFREAPLPSYLGARPLGRGLPYEMKLYSGVYVEKLLWFCERSVAPAATPCETVQHSKQRSLFAKPDSEQRLRKSLSLGRESVQHTCAICPSRYVPLPVTRAHSFTNRVAPGIVQEAFSWVS